MRAKTGRVAHYTLHLSNGQVEVFHPTKAEPLVISEDEAGRRIDSRDPAELRMAAERYAADPANLRCECGGEYTYDPGHRDTREEPGVPPAWSCEDCGDHSLGHPALVRAFVAGAGIVAG